MKEEHVWALGLALVAALLGGAIYSYNQDSKRDNVLAQQCVAQGATWITRTGCIQPAALRVKP